MAELYSNENFPLRVVQELRELGHDVLTSYESGRANQRISDQEVLAFGAGQNRAILTLNRRDFVHLHRDSSGEHAGIIVCTRDDSDPRVFAGRIDKAIAEQGALPGCLVRVTR